MTDRERQQPNLTPSKKADKAARGDRLAAEMRKNLMKRKQQQRQKSDIAIEANGESGGSDDQG